MVHYSPELHEKCFPFLDKTDALALLSATEIIAFKEGAILYKANDSADCLYVLISGRIAVQKHTGFGDRKQVVALLDPGAPIGESGLLDGQSRGALLAVVEDSCLLALSRQSFVALTRVNPTLSVKVLKWVIGRLALRLKKSSERLAHVL
jgi:CRP-like cAMP-binding protein